MPTLGFPALLNSKRGFEAFAWILVAITFIFLAVRLFVRIRVWRLFWDDALLVLAWLLALSTDVTWQMTSRAIHRSLDPATGAATTSAAITKNLLALTQTTQLVVQALFFTSLWAAKMSFLVFSKRLCANVHNQRSVWWPVFGFTAVAYFVCIGTGTYYSRWTQFDCPAASSDGTTDNCASDADINAVHVTLKLACALDVLSDMAVAWIPIMLLVQVRIPLKKKLALIGCFSLVLFTIAASIIRVASVQAEVNDMSMMWLCFWSNMEQSVAIIVVCLTASPQLFTHSARAAKPVCKPSETTRRRPLNRKKQPLRDSSLLDWTRTSDERGSPYVRAPDMEARNGSFADSMGSVSLGDTALCPPPSVFCAGGGYGGLSRARPEIHG